MKTFPTEISFPEGGREERSEAERSREERSREKRGDRGGGGGVRGGEGKGNREGGEGRGEGGGEGRGIGEGEGNRRGEGGEANQKQPLHSLCCALLPRMYAAGLSNWFCLCVVCLSVCLSVFLSVWRLSTQKSGYLAIYRVKRMLNTTVTLQSKKMTWCVPNSRQI